MEKSQMSEIFPSCPLTGVRSFISFYIKTQKMTSILSIIIPGTSLKIDFLYKNTENYQYFEHYNTWYVIKDRFFI
jgi:hypothetical protein